MAIGGVGLALAAAVAAAPAFAQPRFVAKHNDWQVYVSREGQDRICFAVTDAKDKNPRNVDHGRVSARVASWRSGAAKDQPSFVFGYPLKPEGPTRARVGRESWTLYGVGPEAYADDEDEDALVAAMKAGSSLRVETVSQRGTETTYEFSLSGVTAALREAAAACGPASG